jgi:hypothetical protein
MAPPAYPYHELERKYPRFASGGAAAAHAVLAPRSSLLAATVIGRPRIDPELSIDS